MKYKAACTPGAGKTGLLSISTILAVCLGCPGSFHAAESSWSTKSPMPNARMGLTTSVVDGKIYAMGGGATVYGPYLADVEIYDPVTDFWNPGIAMTRARAGHAAVVVGGKIYVTGGAYQYQTSTCDPALEPIA